MYPFKPSTNKFAALWGDSLTFQMCPFLRALTDYNVYNLGLGGQISTTIRTAFDIGPPEQRQCDAMLIWPGRNNYSDPTTVKADIADMVSKAPANYLVLSILNGESETLGNSAYNLIVGLNADLAALYGAKYWDARSYLITQHDQSAQDLTDVANDVVPTSLRSDAVVHLNPAGYALVAAGVKTRLGL